MTLAATPWQVLAVWIAVAVLACVVWWAWRRNEPRDDET